MAFGKMLFGAGVGVQTGRAFAGPRRLVGLLALCAMLPVLSACSRSAEPAATPAPAAQSAPAPAPAASPLSVTSVEPLTLTAEGGRLTMKGTVATEIVKSQLAQEAAAIYGADKVVNQLNVDPAAVAPAWLPQANTLMAWLKPGAPLSVSGDASYITLSGTVPSTAEQIERVRWASEFFGSSVSVNNDLKVGAAGK